MEIQVGPDREQLDRKELWKRQGCKALQYIGNALVGGVLGMVDGAIKGAIEGVESVTRQSQYHEEDLQDIENLANNRQAHKDL